MSLFRKLGTATSVPSAVHGQCYLSPSRWFRLSDLWQPRRPRCRVLFVCLGNACRSQMAEAFATARASDVLRATSAGLLPSRAISNSTHKVMHEKRISLEHHSPKMVDRLDLTHFHMIVNLSGRTLPRSRGLNALEWNIPDPMGHDIDFYRTARDRVEAQVVELAQQLRASAAARTYERRLILRARLAWRNLWIALLLCLGMLAGTAQAGPVYQVPPDWEGSQPTFPLGGFLAPLGWSDGSNPPPAGGWLDPDVDKKWERDLIAPLIGPVWHGPPLEVHHPWSGWYPSCYPPGGDPGTSVPEPSAAALLVGGLAALLAARRRVV